ncbi:MAG TPA: hypothetical protein VF748_14660 [Candidatus Acidoferrum sp.]
MSWFDSKWCDYFFGAIFVLGVSLLVIAAVGILVEIAGTIMHVLGL